MMKQNILGKITKQRIFILLAAVAVIILPIFISNSYIISILILTIMYAALSSAWNFISGYAGQFGFGLFFALGAYVCGGLFTDLGVSPWIGMIVAGLVSVVIGVIAGLITFPLHGAYYTISTLAILNILQLIFSQEKVIFGIKFNGTAGLKLPWNGDFASMQFMDKRVYYYIILAILIITILISYKISKSRPGYYFKAINTNQMAASSLGVSVLKYKMYAQVLTAFIMGVIGGFYVMYLTAIEPISMFSFEIVFNILLFAIVGGRATVFGPVIGAAILMPAYSAIRFFVGSALPGLPTALFGIILVIFVMYMPEGLVPFIKEKAYAKRLRAESAAKKSSDK